MGFPSQRVAEKAEWWNMMVPADSVGRVGGAMTLSKEYLESCEDKRS